jgi:hypothetical protein
VSIKLRVLAEMDVEYAKELNAFFKQNGLVDTEYLDMTIDEFIQFCEQKLAEWNQQVKGVMQKREHGRNSHF